MDNWYYKIDDRIVGPVTRQELDYLMTIGQLRRSTMVRSGEAGEWRRSQARKRLATADAPAMITAAVEAAKQEEARPPSQGEAVETPSPPLAASDPKDGTVRKQAIAGVILAVVLLMVFWLLRDTLSQMASDGVNAGQNMVGNADNSDESGVSASESAPAGAANEGTEATTTQTSGGDSPTTGDSAVMGENTSVTQQSDQAAANMSDQTAPPETGSVASMLPARNAVQPGNPLSKFTIAAPGEATFFGLSASGNHFVFVVDRSGSMQGEPLARAKAELMKCIHRMPEHVHVHVLFFDYGVLPDPAGSGQLTAQRVIDLERWVRNVTTGSGTDAKVGMQYALTQSSPPDAIFLLTDGEFSVDTPSYIQGLNDSNSSVHTIALVSRVGESMLKQIANQNNGDYRFVP